MPHLLLAHWPGKIMQFPSITAVDGLVILTSFYFVLLLHDHRRRRGLPYPPGPRSWPIIGNLLDVPSRRPWVTYSEMSKKYGEGYSPLRLSSTY
jgi:hypothetical protein